MKRTQLVALAAVVAVFAAWFLMRPGWVAPGAQLIQAHAQNAPAAVASTAAPVPDPGQVDQDLPYRESCAREGLNESECVGRLIWFKATAGNERFHTYTFQQRVGVLVDWFRVLRADQRDDRFWAWGIINDPSCCKPGDADCPARSLDETYGFDWCPGDDVLLKYVGKQGYVDPACGLKDAALDPQDPHSQAGKLDQRHSACDLKFGTSTGALGIRKFPNPRFDAEKWKAVNGGFGGNAGWAGFDRRMDSSTGIESDSRVSKLADASIEPPFLIGTSCGSCHIAFDPLKPPADPAHPKWENIKGLVGNQYTRMSELLGSGMPKSALEYQMFAHARPGVTDTSAISHDQVNNPGTINALVNVAQRPVFKGEAVSKWRKVAECGAEKDEGKCWCEPGRQGKCWQFSTRSDDVTPVFLAGTKVNLPGIHHILKGGEDSTGAHEAIQRVYFNIGSCSEQCWVNHFTDMRQVDPEQRGFGQTPFNVGQCRRDCPNFRAVEDRLQNILDFFASAESDETDLHVARANARKLPAYSRADLVADLDKEFGKGSVARGQTVFAENCARCHSSIPEAEGGPFKSRDFAAPNDAHPRKLRADFLGNDQATPVTEVGTFRCRALHSNHMAGRLYMEYGNEAMRGRGVVPDIPEQDALKNGGRGYMRNVSLVNVWATAPFMHNNAIGPEICGKPANKANDFHRARYARDDNTLLASQPECLRYDPSVDGRFDLYKRSMHELLHPAARGRKITLTNADLLIDLGIRPLEGKTEKPLGGFGQVKIPQGASAGFINSLLHKQLIGDIVLAKRDPARLEAAGKKALVPTLQAIADEVIAQPGRFVAILREKRDFLSANYQTCDQLVENEGHRFGEDLSEADKKAVIAFLATL